MLLNKFSTLHIVEIDSSLLFLGYSIIIHMLAVVALMLPMNLPQWLLAMLFFVVASSATYHILWRSFRQVGATKLFCHPDGSFTVVFNNKTVENVQLNPEKVYLSSWLIILPLMNNEGRYSLSLWRDSLSYKDWRILHALVHQIAGTGVSDETRFTAKL